MHLQEVYLSSYMSLPRTVLIITVSLLLLLFIAAAMHMNWAKEGASQNPSHQSKSPFGNGSVPTPTTAKSSVGREASKRKRSSSSRSTRMDSSTTEEDSDAAERDDSTIQPLLPAAATTTSISRDAVKKVEEKRLADVFRCTRDPAAGRRQYFDSASAACRDLPHFAAPLRHDLGETTPDEIFCRSSRKKRRMAADHFKLQYGSVSGQTVPLLTPFEKFQLLTSWGFDQFLPFDPVPAPLTKRQEGASAPLRGFHHVVSENIYRLRGHICLSPFNGLGTVEGSAVKLEPLRSKDDTRNSYHGLYAVRKLLGDVRQVPRELAVVPSSSSPSSPSSSSSSSAAAAAAAVSFDRRPVILFDMSRSARGNIMHALLRLLSLIGTLKKEKDGQLFEQIFEAGGSTRVKPLIVCVFDEYHHLLSKEKAGQQTRNPGDEVEREPKETMRNAFRMLLPILFEDDYPITTIVAPRVQERNPDDEQQEEYDSPVSASTLRSQRAKLALNILRHRGRLGQIEQILLPQQQTAPENQLASALMDSTDVCFENAVVWGNCVECAPVDLAVEKESYSFGMHQTGSTPSRMMMLQEYRRLMHRCVLQPLRTDVMMTLSSHKHEENNNNERGSASPAPVHVHAHAAAAAAAEQLQESENEHLPLLVISVRQGSRSIFDSALVYDLLMRRLLRGPAPFYRGVMFVDHSHRNSSLIAHIEKVRAGNVFFGVHGANFVDIALMPENSIVVEAIVPVRPHSCCRDGLVPAQFLQGQQQQFQLRPGDEDQQAPLLSREDATCWYRPFSEGLSHDHIAIITNTTIGSITPEESFQQQQQREDEEKAVASAVGGKAKLLGHNKPAPRFFLTSAYISVAAQTLVDTLSMASCRWFAKRSAEERKMPAALVDECANRADTDSIIAVGAGTPQHLSDLVFVTTGFVFEIEELSALAERLRQIPETHPGWATQRFVAHPVEFWKLVLTNFLRLPQHITHFTRYGFFPQRATNEVHGIQDKAPFNVVSRAQFEAAVAAEQKKRKRFAPSHGQIRAAADDALEHVAAFFGSNSSRFAAFSSWQLFVEKTNARISASVRDHDVKCELCKITRK